MTGAQLDHGPDECPACGRHIRDYDDGCCEVESGQRWCLDHLPRDVDPELYDAWQAHLHPSIGNQV